MSAVVRALRAFAFRALGVRDLGERLRAVEEDLDCDSEGSLAQALAEVQAEVRGLRARLDEWEPGRAADELYRGGS